MGHTFSRVLIHLAFSTKGRRRWIQEPLRERLLAYLGGIVREEFRKCICVGGAEDHIHALVEAPMDMAPSQAVRKLKSQSSHWVHQEFPDLAAFEWQGGYGAFSVSPSKVEDVITYIETQQAHHRAVTFDEEYRAMLQKHGGQFDPDHYLD